MHNMYIVLSVIPVHTRFLLWTHVAIKFWKPDRTCKKAHGIAKFDFAIFSRNLVHSSLIFAIGNERTTDFAHFFVCLIAKNAVTSTITYNI